MNKYLDFANKPLFPIVCALIGGTAAIYLFPFVDTMPDHLRNAYQLATEGHVESDTFMPIGYSLLLAPFVMLFASQGVILCQTILYALSIFLAWKFLHNFISDSPILILIGTLSIAFHPYLLLGISRTNDNSLNTLLVIILCYWLIGQNGVWRYAIHAPFYGAILGLLIFTRANSLVFMAIPFLLFFFNKRKDENSLKRLSTFCFAVLATYIVLSFLGTGHYFFWPGNGPYNLFAGNNPFSISELLRNLNAEYSIPVGLAYYNIDSTGLDVHVVSSDIYTSLSFRFMVEMPIEFMKVTLLKVLVLFSPNWRLSDNLIEYVIQVLLTFPILAFLGLQSIQIRTCGWFSSMPFLIFLVLFVFPFALTNSDPRFRLPLDIALILYSITCFAQLHVHGWHTNNRTVASAA